MHGSPDARSESSSRYVLYDELAAGGMATVYLGLQRGGHDFRRVVAVKRMHPHLAKQDAFAEMFRDEARISARVQHPNIASILDVVVEGDELLLVMEYVHGESLAKVESTLTKREERVPLEIAASIGIGILHGLHAAHEARSASGTELRIVHRDVSPQNVLVGADGVPRVVDFGIARAVGRLETTGEGQVRGKAAYMAPEQVRGRPLDRRADLYAASVVLWELLAGRRRFSADSATEVMLSVLESESEPPSVYVPEVACLDEVVMRGMARDPEERFGTALAMAQAIEAIVRPASAHRVAEWLDHVAGDTLRARRARVDAIEAGQTEPLGPSVAARRTSLARAADRVPEASPVRRRSAKWVALIAVAIGALASVAAAWFRHGGAPAGADVEEPAPAVSVSGPVEQPLPTVLSAPSTASPLPAARASSPKPKGQKRPASRGANCDPPYVIDHDGFRAPKRECL